MPARPAGLFGSLLREEILKAVVLFDQGVYGRQLSELLGHHLLSVQRNLGILEQNGILASRFVGGVRLYELNRRYRYLQPLRALLQTMARDDTRLRQIVESIRQRPRRAGKAL